ncbi:MAG TPA: Xaa-Pro peptidase family protein [Terriglobales bacterium]|nr:Xaa-Pro peptidase family protein [Terriglobales bacterium]
MVTNQSPEDVMDYGGRQRRVAQVLDASRLDALLVTHSPNVRYLCGFTGSASVLLVANGRPTFFTDGRYREQAGAEVEGARVVVPKGPILDAAARAVADSKAKTVGVESEHLSMAAAAQVARTLRPKTRVRQTQGLVEKHRMVKEPAEVECMRAAVRLASSLFDKAVAAIHPGVPERAVAAELEYAARCAGADGMSFETIVAAGPRSALPHGLASAQPIPRRGFVVLDFGVILRGYCSDMTRTVHVGKPTAEVRRLYQAVRDAQQAAVEAVRPGRTVGEVDRAARSLLRRAGLARYFTHSTGHGVGLEIHEPPRIAHGQQEVLRPGMVITIEPGVYVPGYGGVRIEDMVVVTTTSCEVLTPTTKELLAV